MFGFSSAKNAIVFTGGYIKGKDMVCQEMKYSLKSYVIIYHYLFD